MVVNASNREKIVRWIESQRRPDDEVRITDQTFDTAMIAVQGPQALATVAPLVAVDLDRMKYYTGAMTDIAGQPGIVSRTGYTGEDGCELIVAKEVAIECVAGGLGPWPAMSGRRRWDSGHATRCGSRRRCRSTGTN